MGIKRWVVAVLAGAFLAACGPEDTSDDPIPPVQESTTLGRAVFSIQNPGFDCDGFFESVKSLPTLNLAFLWRTFGEETACLKRVLSDERLEVLEVHLTNGTCDRQGRRCGSYEFKAGLTDEELSKRLVAGDRATVERFEEFASSYRGFIGSSLNGRTCLVSPMLEADITDDAARKIVTLSKKHLPACLIVWNPLRHRVVDVGQDLTELHGLSVIADVANNDGEWRGEEEAVLYLLSARDAFVRFLWTFEDNCIRQGVGFVDPRQRDCSEQRESFPIAGSLLKWVYEEELRAK